ncbi:hypothetical protein Aduo_013924 [Ancylostoma duodenale]
MTSRFAYALPMPYPADWWPFGQSAAAARPAADSCACPHTDVAECTLTCTLDALNKVRINVAPAKCISHYLSRSFWAAGDKKCGNLSSNPHFCIIRIKSFTYGGGGGGGEEMRQQPEVWKHHASSAISRMRLRPGVKHSGVPTSANRPHWFVNKLIEVAKRK